MRLFIDDINVSLVIPSNLSHVNNILLLWCYLLI